MAGDDKPTESGDGTKPAAAKDREGAAGRVSRHKNRRANRAGAGVPAAKLIAFKGRIDNLSGHVYNYSDNRQSNYSLNGLDNYPRTITAAYNLLVNWKGDPAGRQPRHVVSDGVAFTNNSVALVNPRCPKKDMATVNCHNCGEYGHYATDCPKPKKQTGKQLLMAGVESGEFNNDVASR
jgi:hypothetical protein